MINQSAFVNPGSRNNLMPVPMPTSATERIRHTRIKEVAQEIETLIYPSSSANILLIVGPTGVGKTTLTEYLVERELQGASAAMATDPGHVPAVYIEAEASGEREFSWRSFFSALLVALDGEQQLPKVAYGVDSDTGRLVKPIGPKRESLAALRSGVERSLNARKTRFIVIDEAAHIFSARNRGSLTTQLQTLTSLSNRCGVQIVLVGSYDLYDLMSLSAQLARRTHVVHFERYREDRPEDVRAFATCVELMAKKLANLRTHDLLPYAEALQKNTLGCVGTLSTVLARANQFAGAAGGWSEDRLCRALLTQVQTDQILQEILDGEAAINPGLTRPSLSAPGTKRRGVR